MSVTVTLVFPDAAAAANALDRLARPSATPVISPADNPAVGVEPETPQNKAIDNWPATHEPNLAAVFGQQSAAPLAPVPPAATVPPTPPQMPGATPTVERDSAGMPWDSRIHAGSKTTNKDGTWRQKRELDPTFKVQVEAELRQAQSAAPAAASAPSQPTAAAVPTLSPLNLPTLPTPTATPAAAPATAPQAESFAEFMVRVMPLYTSDPLNTPKRMGAALAKHGLTAIGGLSTRPDLLPLVIADFDAAATV